MTVGRWCSASPRSMSPRRRGRSAPGFRIRVPRGGGSPRCGTWVRPPALSWTAPTNSVASDIFGRSGRAMLDALIAGERDPEVLADLALGKMRPKRAALKEALTGRFDEHHAELIDMLLDEVDALTAKIDTLTERVGQLL